MKIGYKRVSTLEQNLDRQDFQDVDKIFEEKTSGSTSNRPVLEEMIEFVREGDQIFVWSIDRLARNLRDLQDIIKQLTKTTATGEKKTKRRKIRSSAVAKESIIDPLEGISKPIAYSHTGTDIYSRSKIDQRWYHLRAVSSISSSLFLKYA